MSIYEEDFAGTVYYDRDSAEETVRRLKELGYTQNDISVMMKDRDQAEKFARETGTKAPEGAVTGGIIGGGLGAIIAALTATGSVAAVVGTGGVAAPLVVGPLAAALAGLGAGGLAGGIVGALVGAGIPEERAREYESGLKKGGMLVGVQPRKEHREELQRLFSPAYGTDEPRTDTGTVDYGQRKTPVT